MPHDTRLNWLRITLAAIGAVVLPILALIVVVFGYGIIREADSLSPEAFAPIAGAWVGLIGGFLCTLIFAYWVAKHSAERPVSHGLTVGVLSAMFDYLVGILLGASFQLFFLFCYGTRILAGLIGGMLGTSVMHVHRTMTVQCKTAAFWRCLTDVTLLKQWISTLVDETIDDPSKTGLGALSTIHIREGKKIVAYRSLVTVWEPEHRLAIRMSGGSFPLGMEMDITYELSSAEGSETRLDYNVRAQLQGVMFKLMGPIMCLVGAGNAKRDLAKLEALASSMSSNADGSF